MALEPLAVLRASELDPAAPEQRWLIRPLWLRAAVGIIGGHAKSCKTWLGIDMAVSIASGTPCLMRLPVCDPGRTLIYLAEDDLPAVRGRIESLSKHRGIDIGALDLHVITDPVLRLDQLPDQKRLAQALERLRPRMLLLDPLIRLHNLNENDASEISRLLSYFRELQRRFDCAVIVTHHAGKKDRARPGQALRGSSDLHAWTDSSAYLARQHDRFVLTVEHRSAQAPKPALLELRGDGTPHLEWISSDDPTATAHTPNLAERVIDALRGQTAPMTRSALREVLHVKNETLGTILSALQQRSRVQRLPTGWVITEPGK